MKTKSLCTEHPDLQPQGVCAVCLQERLNQLLIHSSDGQHSVCSSTQNLSSSHSLKIRTPDVAGTEITGDGSVGEERDKGHFKYNQNRSATKLCHWPRLLYCGHRKHKSAESSKRS
ncbi:hypothetical protein SUGI_0312110 [Cryptomeria japonica]|nr:hypothetical protein SUGI_0312110 [Cryptomeria japonica]